jgi:hypothetical protein
MNPSFIKNASPDNPLRSDGLFGFFRSDFTIFSLLSPNVISYPLLRTGS